MGIPIKSPLNAIIPQSGMTVAREKSGRRKNIGTVVKTMRVKIE